MKLISQTISGSMDTATETINRLLLADNVITMAYDPRATSSKVNIILRVEDDFDFNAYQASFNQ